MKYNLKTPIMVYSNDTGSEVEAREVEVVLRGKLGVQDVMRVTDIIAKSFKDHSEANTKATKKTNNNNERMTVDDMYNALLLSGSSSDIFDAVCQTIVRFGRAGKANLSNNNLDEMDVDDLQGLYEQVLKEYFLGKLIQRMNSMMK